MVSSIAPCLLFLDSSKGSSSQCGSIDSSGPSGLGEPQIWDVSDRVARGRPRTAEGLKSSYVKELGCETCRVAVPTQSDVVD